MSNTYDLKDFLDFNLKTYGFIAPKILNYLAFQSCVPWALFQKRIVCTTFDIYVFAMVSFRIVFLYYWQIVLYSDEAAQDHIQGCVKLRW